MSEEARSNNLDHIRHVAKHRNVFEANSQQIETSADQRDSNTDVGDKRRTIVSHAGKPCILQVCKCICEHKHEPYTDDGSEFFGTYFQFTGPQVIASRDNCPIPSHGISR